jgi:RHH-type rel operon transcriptional repressor/antitoxin RelB
MGTNTKSESAVVRIPQEMDKRLSQLAKRSGRSKIYYLREALSSYLEDMEDLALAHAAEAEMKNESWLSHAEIKKKLGLDS